MKKKVTTQYHKDGIMRTYMFEVVVKPSEDRWFAYCPILEEHGGATWGYTKEDALKNIEEVVQMVVESMIKHGEEIPIQSETEKEPVFKSLIPVRV